MIGGDPEIVWFETLYGRSFHAFKRADLDNLPLRSLCGQVMQLKGEPVPDNGLPGLEGSDCIHCSRAMRRRHSSPEKT